MSKVESEPMEESQRVRAVGALTSGPLVNVGENIREFFTPLTTMEDVSAQPNALDVIVPANNAATESATHDSRA